MSEKQGKIKSIFPLQSIKSHCLHHCMNHQPHEVELCTYTKCLLYPIRHGKKCPGVSPLKAIKAYCTDCNDGIRNIEKCPFSECQLFLFRKGKNPNLKGKRGNKPKGVNPFKKGTL